MFYFLVVLFSVVADQALKIWVVANIPLHEHIPFLPYLMDLTYIQNTGAAFSFLSGQTGFLTLISLGMSIFLAVLLQRKFFSRPFGRLSMALVLGGAIGNLIDRAFRGFVVDMFNLLFMRFAIFNIADICVVVGGIGCAIYYAFYYEKYDAPPEENPEETPTEEALAEEVLAEEAQLEKENSDE